MVVPGGGPGGRGSVGAGADGGEGGVGGGGGGKEGEGEGEGEGEVELDAVEGLMENEGARVRLSIDADERMMMWKLRRSLHADDFNRIFNPRDRRIGEVT